MTCQQCYDEGVKHGQERQPLTEDKTNKHAINVPGYGWVDAKAVRAIEHAHEIGKS